MCVHHNQRSQSWSWGLLRPFRSFGPLLDFRSIVLRGAKVFLMTVLNWIFRSRHKRRCQTKAKEVSDKGPLQRCARASGPLNPIGPKGFNCSPPAAEAGGSDRRRTKQEEEEAPEEAGAGAGAGSKAGRHASTVGRGGVLAPRSPPSARGPRRPVLLLLPALLKRQRSYPRKTGLLFTVNLRRAGRDTEGAQTRGAMASGPGLEAGERDPKGRGSGGQRTREAPPPSRLLEALPPRPRGLQPGRHTRHL